MQKIPYWKYEGAGNDFVALDAREGVITPDAALVREVCHRRLGIGADGVLVIEPVSGAEADFRMVYFNADGSRGEMCGNGARCIAAFALMRQAARPEMRFATDAGVHRAIVSADSVSVEFPPLSIPPATRRAITEARAWEGHHLIVGVPHFVTWVENLDRIEVTRVGRALRAHDAFGPRGTNVNFAQIIDESTLRVRTYERGVEAETLACGTGSIATAWSYALRSGLSGPVSLTVRTASGQDLQVSLTLRPDGAEEVFLKGPARLVHEGIWSRP